MTGANVKVIVRDSQPLYRILAEPVRVGQVVESKDGRFVITSLQAVLGDALAAPAYLAYASRTS